jgi:hypothetical protein
MITEDLYCSVEPEPTQPSRQTFELAPGVMPFERQDTHLPELRICTRGKDIPLRAFNIHLDEVEAFYMREADRVVPADTHDLLGFIAGGAQRILDRATLQAEVPDTDEADIASLCAVARTPARVKFLCRSSKLDVSGSKQ